MTRRDIAAQLASACAADVVQSVGKVWVLYKANPEAEPRLSNLARFGVSPPTT
jgi:RNA-binding protein YhbY